MDLTIDIFNLDSEQEETITMTTKQFISKTREILVAIDKSYGSCWESRYPTDKEGEILEEKEFYGMTGTIEIDGKEIDCVVDGECGETLIREFDSERFADEIEEVMYHNENSPFYELLMCEVTDEAE